MLGVDDFVLILVATTLANLVVEVGAEVIAEWVVNSPDSPIAAPGADPVSDEILHTPSLMTQASVGIDETTGYLVDRISLKANELNTLIGETLAWSQQMIGTLGVSLGLQ